MGNQELVELLSTVIKREISPISDRLDSLEKATKTTNDRLDSLEKTTNNRLRVLEVKADITHRKIGNLEFAMKSMERDIKKDIRMLYDAQETLIVILEGKGILPQVRG